MIFFLALFSLTSVSRWIEAGGYLVLFGLLFACGLGLPLPEDIPLTIAGFMVAQDHMHLATAAIVAWCGIIGGDVVLYHFGKRYGLGITKVRFVGKHLTPERIKYAEALFEKYGIWVVAIGRLFAGIRGAMVVAAGAVRFSLVKFIIADGLAAIVSGGLFIWLGHWAGKTFGTMDKLQDARKKMAGYEHWFFLALLVVVAAFGFYIWLRKRRHVVLTDVVLHKASDRLVHKDADGQHQDHQS